MKLVSFSLLFGLFLLGCTTTNPLDMGNDSSQVIDIEKAQYHNNLGDKQTRRGNYYWAKKHYLDAITYDPTDYKLWRSAGLAAKRNGDLNEAIQYYLKAVELNPNDYGSYGSMGTIYSDLKNYPEAISNYQKVLSINNGDLRATAYLAELYYELHDYTNCEKYMKQFELTLSKKDTHYLSDDTRRGIERTLSKFSSYRTLITKAKQK